MTAEVRDYANNMTDNEKKALNLEVGVSSPVHGGGGSEADGGGSALTEAEREKGMVEMSRKYEEMGSELYLFENGKTER